MHYRIHKGDITVPLPIACGI